MIFFCLMGSGMFAGSAPSLRIRALGPDMAYLVCDTLADTRLNPASGHRAFISGYGLVLDTPGVGFANADWVVDYSLDDIYGPIPYDPTYLTGTLRVSRRFGSLWPFIHLTGRLLAGNWFPGDYYDFYDYRNMFLLSARPGIGFAGEGWEGAFSLGYGYSRDTFSYSYDYFDEQGNRVMGEDYNLYRDMGLRVEAITRFFAGANKDWVLGLGATMRFSAGWWRDSTLRVISGPTEDTTIVDIDEGDRESYGLNIRPGVMREIRLGPDATCWVGLTSTFDWGYGRYGDYSWDGSGELYLSVPGGVEIAFGPEQKRFFVRAGIRAYEYVYFFRDYYNHPVGFEQPAIKLGYHGFGLRLYDRLVIDVAKDYMPVDFLDYRLELTYCF